MTEMTTPKGFSVVRMTAQEAYEKGYGIEGGIVCMDCNCLYEDKDEVYYVAVLNDFMCSHCYHLWHKEAVYYPEDAEYEAENLLDFKRMQPNEYSHSIVIHTF